MCVGVARALASGRLCSGATQVQLIDEQGIGTRLRSVRRTSGYEFTGDCLRGHGQPKRAERVNKWRNDKFGLSQRRRESTDGIGLRDRVCGRDCCARRQTGGKSAC